MGILERKCVKRVLEDAGVGLWEMTLRTGELDVDEIGAELLGYTLAELTPVTVETWEELLHPDDRDRVMLQLQSSRREGGAFDCEYRMRHKDGSWVWFRGRGEVVSRTEEGEPLEMVGSYMEITRQKEVEEGLHRSNERFQSLMTNASEGFYLFELPEPMPTGLPVDEQVRRLYTGFMVECNDAQAQMYGYDTKDALIGKSLGELHGGTDVPENLAFLRDWIESGYRVTGSLSREIDRDGKTLWFSNNVTGVVEDGCLLRIWGTQTDITRIMESEMELRKSEKRYRKAQSVAHVGGWEYDIQTDTFWGSEEGKRIYGLEMSQEVFDAQEVMRLVVDRECVEQAMVNLIEHNRPYDIEFEIRTKDGEVKTIHSIAELIRDDDGDPVKVAGVLHDVTDRKLFDRKLQNRQQQYENLFMNAPDAIFVDIDDRISLINKAGLELFGVDDAEEVIGKSPIELFHPDYHEQIQERIHQLRDLGKAVPLEEWKIIRQDTGDVVDVNVVAAPFMFNDQPAIHVILRDITETKQLNARLRQAEKMEAIGALAGGIAHDFNNILSGILGSADLAFSKLPEDSGLRKHMRIIVQAADRAKALVQQILAFSRRAEEAKHPQKLGPIVREVIDLLRASLPSTIEIRSFIGADTRPVSADPTRIHEIIMNLGANSAHAMEYKGTLYISCEEFIADHKIKGVIGVVPAGPYSQITIRDTGYGMDEQTLSRIFDPFFTTKGPGEGTGMGMAVVYGIVQSHSGTIQVDSEPGVGTEVRVFLPQVHMQRPDDKDQERASNSGNETILLIDDESVIREVGAEMLMELGYTVKTAEDSEEALEIYHHSRAEIDLIITDQTMPGMTGMEFADVIRNEGDPIPIILSTGYSSVVDGDSIKEAGIDGFIAKPYRQNELATHVRTVLDEPRDPDEH